MRAFGNETFILVFLFSSLRVLEGLEVEFEINYLEQIAMPIAHKKYCVWMTEASKY